MPFGFGPSSAPAPTSGPSQYFGEFEEAMRPALDADRAAAEEKYATTVDTINQTIEHTAALKNPIAPTPVPGATNPGLAALAGFFAHLNQAQGGGGGAVAGLQNTLSNLASERERAIAQNAASEQNFSLSKFGSTEALHRDLLTTMRDKAAEMGDLEKTFQHNKALFALERQKRKEDLELAAKIAEGKAATTQQNTQSNIRLRADLAQKRAITMNKLKRETESKVMTPAQRARMAQVNARVAELRAEMDDFRGAKDIAGESVNPPEEIAAREADLDTQIRQLYEDAKLEFEGKGVQAPPPTPPATPAGTASDRVKAAAERLRGTGLFQ